MRRGVMIATIMFGLQIGAATAGKRPLTGDDLLALKRPSTPAISPDGRFVAFTVAEPNWADNRYDRQIWLADVHAGTLAQLTHSKRTNTAPAWSPNGRWLAFISDRDGRRQLYVIAPSAGDARQVTDVDTGVSGFRWSPDGSRIAFTRSDPMSKQMKDRADRYGELEAVREYSMDHLWVVGVEGGQAQRLTGGDTFSVGDFSWSPEGGRIAFDAQPTPSMASDDDSDIYLFTFADRSLRKIVDEPGPDRDPRWSPDGRQIVFQTGMGRQDFFYQNKRLAITSPDGGGIASMTPDFDESADLEGWAPDGIYFTAAQKTTTQLFRINPNTRAVERVSPQDDAMYSAFSFTNDGKSVAFVESDFTHFPELYVAALNGFAPKKLTDYAAQVRDVQAAAREVISWTSLDGTKIEGVLTKPADFDPTRKHPLLVIVHGGPGVFYQSALGFDTPYYPKEMWAAKGALILEPNYRGSIGYGEKFRQLRVGAAGYGDYADVMSGVNALVAKGWVDTARMGLMGWSFGGFVTAFIETQTDRFKAVSVGAGPTDWPAFDAWTELPQITRRYFGAAPWQDPEMYRKSSPIAHIKGARTPTLIHHGDLDPIVPVSSAYELYQALRDQAVPVRFYVYSGSGHNMTRPKAVRAVMEHNLNWFNHYLWGEPDTEASK